MSIRALIVILLSILFRIFAALEGAQSFEVASIKLNTGGGPGGTGMVRTLPGGRLTADAVLPRFFIQNAYGIRSYQIIGGPSWIESDHYDIQAKVEGNPSQDEFRLMMQRLLEDRFKLKAHRETRDLPVFELSPAKSGLKLQAPKEGSCVVANSDGLPQAAPNGQVLTPCGRLVVQAKTQGVQMSGGKIEMTELARVFSNMLGRTVLDKTGYAGAFDVHLEFAFDDALAGIGGPRAVDRPAVSADPTGPSIFRAVQDQLGLKLDSTKGPVEVLVIDHIEKPAQN